MLLICFDLFPSKTMFSQIDYKSTKHLVFVSKIYSHNIVGVGKIRQADQIRSAKQSLMTAMYFIAK